MTQKAHNRELMLASDATDSQLHASQPEPTRTPRSRFPFPTTTQSQAARVLRCLCFFFSLATVASAGVGGSISGTVKDPSGAAIARAPVTLIDTGTGIRQSTTTDGSGTYAFPVLPVGNYVLEVSQSGFKPYRRNGIVLDTSSALLLDVVLQVGPWIDVITVSDTAAHLETSSSQMGEVINSHQMSAVPLDGRSYTDLLSIQAGVAPATSITSSTVQDVGASALSPSGDLNPGTISIHGQREFANAFIVNGSDSEEDVNMGTAIIPDLDSIAEFRILTSNFDAEYGEFSGGQITVITKSGSNAFHGDLFEFLRNTDLDARNYFSPTRGTFIQNQFGGTFGGPIRRNQIFFFSDYQGTRQRQGVDTGLIPVPSSADRSGDLLDQASSFYTTEIVNNQTVIVPTLVSGSAWADTLSQPQRLGYKISPGEPYYFPGCTNTNYSPGSTTACVLPTLQIPTKAWSVPAQNLLQYIPAPNASSTQFATSSQNQALRDDKGSLRLDANTGWGLISGYYFLDDYSLNNPYPVAQGGASVPGFNALYLGRAQLFSVGDTKTLNPTSVNEVHFSYLRAFNDLGKPQGGLGVSLVSQGFVTSTGGPSIVALAPQNEGVENLVFNNFSTGTNTNELKQANNTYQWLDNFSKVIGRHTMKFGGEFHYDQVNVNPIAQFNGNFLFTGSETGLDFADFLLGIPSQYNQSQLNPFYGRNKYTGIFAQDSWRLKPNLTLNYGVRWDRIEPWYEKYNQISTTEPGKQSVVFPGAPAGILYPTDPGVRRTLAPPGDEFSPRLGLVYSPDLSADTFLGKVLGGPSKTSLRAGFGMYYTSIEALTIGVLAANAPYGTTYSSPAPPTFSNPFVTASTGHPLGQYFPVTFAPLNSSSSHPDSTLDWSQYIPISGIPAYPVSNRIPYTEQYMFSIERQLGNNTVFSASYVGNQSHRLLVLVESNPGDPALCLSLPGCGPFEETESGTRGPLGSNFGSDTNQSTIGNSNYNALELSLRHTSRRLQLFASYTYSKSIDQSSNVGEQVNPINPALSRALSAFDVKHNFVVSYAYDLPFEHLFGVSNRWTRGWTISGITHFSSGFPVTLLNYGDNSLLGAEPNGINNYGVDEPQYAPGPLDLNSNPRNGRSYFNTSLFSLQPLGEPGNAKRRFFYGPGIDNYDMALLKTVPLTESKSLQFRLEGFNVFNHAQFYGPASVNGNINSSSFGEVVSAAAPRLMQAAVKFIF
ncbi:MAG: carboxypeptidase regulatory-like domain-containing protein [Candidatus Sulfotelmatobacter sp.]